MSTVAVSFSRCLFAIAVFTVFAIAAIPAMAEPAAPLVSAQWLKGHQGDPAVVVLDVRSAIDGGGAETYAKAHIPGAVHSDYDKAGWRVTRNGVPFMLPNKVGLEKLIGETGIDEDAHVVIVPAGVSATDFGSAARVYWTLKIAGHPAVSILDGGFAAWQAAAFPIESGKVTPAPSIFTVKLDDRLLAEVEAVERNTNATLVDARPPGYIFPARRRRRPPRLTATFPVRSTSTAPRSTIR